MATPKRVPSTRPQFRILLDRGKYVKFEGLADATATAGNLATLKASRKVRDEMISIIARNSYDTEYGDALKQAGLTPRHYHTQTSGNYDSITQAIVVHTNRVKRNGNIYYSIGARTRGHQAYVNGESAGDILDKMNYGVSYDSVHTFDMTGGRQAAAPKWHTFGMEPKNFISDGKRMAIRTFRAVPAEMLFMTKQAMIEYIKTGSSRTARLTAELLRLEKEKGMERR